MDFDLSKENIQPLRGGRNVSQLEVALQAQTNQEYQRELLQQREEFEKLIRTYTGPDPLENWYNYVSWVEQSYPKHGHEGNLVPLLEHCLRIFEKDVRYTNDRRLCKMLIKYIDHQQNPLELYHMLFAQGLCRGCADMYRAWAYYHEAAGDFQSAHGVFEYGKQELAQPYEELDTAHKNLVLAAGQHMLYGPDESGLIERRQALTSLCTYRLGRVGSVRTVDSHGPGTFGTAAANKPNAGVPVYEDQGVEVRGAEAAPISILTAAKRQDVPKENTLKPGPWTTVPVKKRHAGPRATPSFTVHEDSADGDRLQIASPVKISMENYANWIVSLTLPEPKDDRMKPMYPKSKVYCEVSTEYSLEEIRASRYLAKKVAPTETNQAVQSILDGDISIMDFTINRSNDKLDKSDRSKSNFKQSLCSFESRQVGISPALNQANKHFQSPARAAENVHSPASDDHQGANTSNFDIWKEGSDASPLMVAPKITVSKFTIYEQSNVGMQEQIEPKGSAMKTPFKDWNTEELAETGSRGGMDVAAAAPVDSAKRLPNYDDDSSSSFDQISEIVNVADLSCNTQMFNFNLNAMQVSTPQNKQGNAICDGDSAKKTRKQLFTETTKTESERGDKLSVIMEETKSYGLSSSSSSSSTAAKSSTFNNHTKPTNMATISEEHNSYLAQNLMANAALRSSLLGNFMDLNPPASPVVLPKENMETEIINLTIPSPVSVTPIDCVPSNPFKPSLIDQLLKRVSFPGSHTSGYHILNNVPKLTVRKDTVTVGSDKYVVEKQIGKGTYGTVFRAVDLRTANTVALKYQKPPNRWEFYICRELQSRLAQHPLRERFMDVTVGYFSEQASVLVSEFVPSGSLLNVTNMVKQKTGRAMKESLCIYFCLEMLKVVQAMHEVNIIHADIKPDNFLVYITSNDTVGLQLIDFGCSIDMSLFPSGASFTRKVTTEDFICCEMMDGRPWNYHTDLYCVAATAHVLIFEKYIQLQNKGGLWSISQRLPRYISVDLWNTFFGSLLNQQNGPADCASLQVMLDDCLNHKFDDYHSDMRFLKNILKNR